MGGIDPCQSQGCSAHGANGGTPETSVEEIGKGRQGRAYQVMTGAGGDVMGVLSRSIGKVFQFNEMISSLQGALSPSSIVHTAREEDIKGVVASSGSRIQDVGDASPEVRVGADVVAETANKVLQDGDRVELTGSQVTKLCAISKLKEMIASSAKALGITDKVSFKNIGSVMTQMLEKRQGILEKPEHERSSEEKSALKHCENALGAYVKMLGVAENLFNINVTSHGDQVDLENVHFAMEQLSDLEDHLDGQSMESFAKDHVVMHGDDQVYTALDIRNAQEAKGVLDKALASAAEEFGVSTGDSKESPDLARHLDSTLGDLFKSLRGGLKDSDDKAATREKMTRVKAVQNQLRDQLGALGFDLKGDNAHIFAALKTFEEHHEGSMQVLSEVNLSPEQHSDLDALMAQLDGDGQSIEDYHSDLKAEADAKGMTLYEYHTADQASRASEIKSDDSLKARLDVRGGYARLFMAVEAQLKAQGIAPKDGQSMDDLVLEKILSYKKMTTAAVRDDLVKVGGLAGGQLQVANNSWDVVAKVIKEKGLNAVLTGQANDDLAAAQKQYDSYPGTKAEWRQEFLSSAPSTAPALQASNPQVAEVPVESSPSTEKTRGKPDAISSTKGYTSPESLSSSSNPAQVIVEEGVSGASPTPAQMPPSDDNIVVKEEVPQASTDIDDDAEITNKEDKPVEERHGVDRPRSEGAIKGVKIETAGDSSSASRPQDIERGPSASNEEKVEIKPSDNPTIAKPDVAPSHGGDSEGKVDARVDLPKDGQKVEATAPSGVQEAEAPDSIPVLGKELEGNLNDIETQVSTELGRIIDQAASLIGAPEKEIDTHLKTIVDGSSAKVETLSSSIARIIQDAQAKVTALQEAKQENISTLKEEAAPDAQIAPTAEEESHAEVTPKLSDAHREQLTLEEKKLEELIAYQDVLDQQAIEVSAMEEALKQAFAKQKASEARLNPAVLQAAFEESASIMTATLIKIKGGISQFYQGHTLSNQDIIPEAVTKSGEKGDATDHDGNEGQDGQQKRGEDS